MRHRIQCFYPGAACETTFCVDFRTTKQDMTTRLLCRLWGKTYWRFLVETFVMSMIYAMMLQGFAFSSHALPTAMRRSYCLTIHLYTGSRAARRECCHNASSGWRKNGQSCLPRRICLSSQT